MTVIRISEYKNRDVIGLLSEALEMAKAGKVTGVCLAMKYDPGHHGIALAGEYYDDPTDVLAVLARITFEVNMRIREHHSEPTTSGAAPQT